MGQFAGMVGSPNAPTGYEDRIWQPLGLPSTPIPTSGASTDVTLTPLTNFKGQRLVLNSIEAPYLTIVGMQVQGISQMASNDPLSADIFTPNSQLTDLSDFADCPAQGEITLTFQNHDSSVHTVTGALFGWAKRRT